MEWTKELIKEKLETDDKWLSRGLLAIYERQTADEKSSEATKHHNGIGFNKVDAGFLTSLAESLKKYGTLTPKQILYCRKKLVKYCGQLEKIARKEI